MAADCRRREVHLVLTPGKGLAFKKVQMAHGWSYLFGSETALTELSVPQ